MEADHNIDADTLTYVKWDKDMEVTTRIKQIEFKKLV